MKDVARKNIDFTIKALLKWSKIKLVTKPESMEIFA